MYDNSLSLTELGKGYGDKMGTVINLMVQTNDIIDDIPWIECNDGAGHKTAIISELPEVHWSKLYEGVAPSKGRRTLVNDTTGMVEAKAIVDKRLKTLYGDKFNEYRLSESKVFMEAMTQEVVQTLFYGDDKSSFKGLAMRYPTAFSPNVIDAGGTTGKLASIWLISFGEQSVHGIYPKGSQAGLQHEDVGIRPAQDEEGKTFDVYEDQYRWLCGLACRDWRGVVRVANIPVDNLGIAYGEPNYVDLRKLMIQAKNKMPASLRKNARWYMNEDLMTAIEIQSTDPKGVHLRYGEYFDSKDVPYVHGKAVRQCDMLLSTEEKI